MDNLATGCRRRKKFLKRHVKLLSAKGAVRPGSTSALPDRNLLSPAEMSYSLSKSFLFQPNLLLIYIYVIGSAGCPPRCFSFWPGAIQFPAERGFVYAHCSRTFEKCFCKNWSLYSNSPVRFRGARETHIFTLRLSI